MKNRSAKWLMVLMAIVLFSVVGCGKSTTTSTGATTLTGKTVTTTTAATTSPATSKPATTTAAPTPTGQLKIALGTIPSSMDPTLSVEGPTVPVLWAMFDYLIGTTPDGQISKNSGIARDWTTTTASGNTTYTINLRQGVKFQNGDEVTSADVKYTIQHAMETTSLSNISITLRTYLDQISTPDPYTVVLTTKQPYPLLLVNFSREGGAGGMVLPAKYIADKGLDYFLQHPIGSGPYRFVEMVSGDHVTFQAIEGKHWLFGVPKYKTLTFSAVPEEATRISNLKTGVVDIIGVSREQSTGLSGFNVFTKQGSSPVVMAFGNMWETGTYLADPRVREALNLAIDRNQILKYVFAGQGKVSGDTLYGTGAIGYQAQPQYAYDPAKAQALLKDAFPNGIELTLMSFPDPSVPELQNMNQAIADMWTKVGVKVNIKPTDLTVWRSAALSGKLTNTAFGFALANRPTLTENWTNILNSKSPAALYKDSKLDALLGAVVSAPDLQAVGQAQAAVAQFLRQNHVAAPIVEVGQVYASSKNIQNWNLGNLLFDPNFQDLVMQPQ